jgi:hypothetical protein
MNPYATAQVVLLLAGVGLIAWLGMAAGLFISLMWIAPIIVAIDLGCSRDRKGWMWGGFLGWLGVLILACMRPQPQAAQWNGDPQ